MGKKGSWLSAIKRVFTPTSKDKPNESDVKKGKKKKGKGRHGDTSSFMPLFREPSSIEKIFGDFEREQQRQGLRPQSPPNKTPDSTTPSFSALPKPESRAPRASESPRKTSESPPRASESPRKASESPRRASESPRRASEFPPRASESPPRASESPRKASESPPRASESPPKASSSNAAPKKTPSSNAAARAESPKTFSSAPPKTPSFVSGRAEVRPRDQNASATTIQAAYRGYKGRKRVRAAKGLARLQGVVEGQSVKRQTANAMKYMQLVVRVHSQIQSRRRSSQTTPEGASSVLLPTPASPSMWDGSAVSKEEAEGRRHRKAQAIVRRERATAYAYGNSPCSYRSTTASPFRDSDSLASCPPFSRRPNYMTPTASAAAKSSTSNSISRRLSYPFLYNNNNNNTASVSASVSGKSRPKSVVSVDSTVSMPAAVGRKPFNRFV